MCAEEPTSLGEVPPEACDGFDSITCGTACGLPTINDEDWCAIASPPLGPPSEDWDIPILDLAGTPIEDGAHVAARTSSAGRLVLPVTLDVASHVATIGWRCYRVEARVTYADGHVVVGPGPWAELGDETGLGQYLSDAEEFHVEVAVDGLGPATLEVMTRWHDGRVLVLRREIVIGC